MLSDIARAVGLATFALLAAVIISLIYFAGRSFLTGQVITRLGASPWSRVGLLAVGIVLVAGVAAVLWGPSTNWEPAVPIAHREAVFMFWAVFVGVPAFGAAFLAPGTAGVRRFAGAALIAYGAIAGASIGYAGAGALATSSQRIAGALIWAAIALLIVAVGLYQTSRSIRGAA